MDTGLHIASDGSTTSPATATTRKIRRKSRMDRLSSLPDYVIGHILSFLDTKSAVQTSILSRRWTYLYTFSTTLHFVKFGKATSSYIYGINRVVMQHKVNIKKFTLRTGFFDDGTNSCYVNSWISAAVSCGVEELELLFSVRKNCCDLNWIPRCLFLSQTLVMFKLSNFGTFPRIPSSVWLPSLKILHMSQIQFLDSSSLTKLFNGCPLLQHLSIEKCRWEAGQVYTIHAVMLRHLKIFNFMGLRNDTIMPMVNFDVPRLEYFKFVGNFLGLYCIRSSNALAIAEITVYKEIKWDLVLSLIKSVSNATTLKLFEETYEFPSQNSVLRQNSVELRFFSSPPALHEPPIFDNLSHLEVTLRKCHSFGFARKILRQLLSDSPNIETLVFKNVSEHCNALSKFVRSPTFTWPPQLKVIQLHGFSGSKEEEKMVTSFFRKAVGLKQLNVNMAIG